MLDLSDCNSPQPICDKQIMPNWSASNSVITQETIPEKIVGFLPLIPHPVTQYNTVYTARKNF